MRQKLLKIELYSLFLLGSLSVAAFYLQDQLSDNLFSISSENGNDPFVVNYWLNSIVAWSAGNLGLWTFGSFILFTFYYVKVFSQRDHWYDPFFIFLILGFSLSFSYITSPFMLGKYLFSSMALFLPTWCILLVVLISTCLLLKLFFPLIRTKISLIPSSLSKIPKFFHFPNRMKVPDLSENLGEVSVADLDTENLENEDQNSLASEPEVIDTNQLKDVLNHELPSDLSLDYEENEYELGDINETPSVNEKSIGPEISGPIHTEVDSKDRSKLANRFDNLGRMEFNTNDLIACIANSDKARKTKIPEEGYFRQIIQSLEEKLTDFKIEGQIVNVLKGPVVDTFELELGTGVAVSKVTRMTEDLSLALKGSQIRIVYPLKGKHTIGIEVPRSPREIIYLDEVLRSSQYNQGSQALPIVMGKDAFGDAFVVDLASMPHMLVAGSTGAGKSVFINTLLVSLLIKKGPKDLRFILIDPKQLELAVYQKLPHLIMPVITEPQMASLSLLWAVEEMEKRYTLLKELGVRNIERFNEKIKVASPDLKAKLSKFYEGREEQGWELPYIVIIVDEFADLILTKNGKEIENNICRLAAKARASGIHLVIATQRPSVDVITGLIKANFPTRVSFRVTSAVDSRTILNSTGAEKLLGRGDMLYKHGVDMMRLHSAYVDEDEIEVLIDKMQSMGVSYYGDAVSFLENGPELAHDGAGNWEVGGSFNGEELSDDDLYREAVRIVTEHRAASASMLQRRLRIGYNRAANLVEQMEQRGVVGPQQGSKPRKVLLSPDEGI